jgi:hypothetical protein
MFKISACFGIGGSSRVIYTYICLPSSTRKILDLKILHKLDIPEGMC